MVGGDTEYPTARLSPPVNLDSIQQEKYLFALKANSLHANKNYRGMIDVHKYRDRCTCALVSLVGIGSHNSTSIQNLYDFVKELNGVIKSDEDYFVFHSEERSLLDKLLISEPFALGIKNKLVVTNERGGDKTYKTTCFYCNVGQPSIYKLKIPDDTTPKNIAIFYPDLLKNFHGKKFRVSSAVLSRWLTEHHQTAPGVWENTRGIFGTALDHLSYKYNFSCIYFPSIGGGGSGLKLENGTWIGAVGDVISGRADIGNAIGQIYLRNLYVGYTFPVCYVWLTFTTSLPQPRYSWEAIYWPFTPLMWFGIFSAIIVSFFAYSFLLKISSQFVPASTRLVYMLKTLMEQGAPDPEERHLNSTRTFLAFWLFFALLISTAYKSKLVSTLAFPLMDEPPKTFEDLSRTNPSFEIILQYVRGAAYTILKTSTNPIFHRVFTRMELEENDARCFQRVIGRPASCISWNTVVDFVLHKNLSDKYGRTPLVKAPDTASFIAVGYVIKKRALFRLKFDKVLMTAVDMGLTEKWWKIDYEFVRRKRRDFEKSVNKTQVFYDDNLVVDDNLSMKQLSGTFYVLSFGLFTAFTSFLVEKAWELRNHKRNIPLLIKN
ncbi:unnamed protein product [Orchesella dallaii]|uniref:Ionotropic glutamate receptor C-terminal domain-containing protein n=1 Tax=Orchesella dallaii TaxID=48710 RepID=A0ABP1QC06_9HEXA